MTKTSSEVSSEEHHSGIQIGVVKLDGDVMYPWLNSISVPVKMSKSVSG